MNKLMVRVINLIISFMLILLLLVTGDVPAKASGYGTIDSTTFKSNYRITTIHIGSDIYDITSNAFYNLNNLRSITVSESNPFYASYSGCLYDKYYTELLCYPPNLSGAYIPETVVSIGKNALHGVPEGIKDQIREVVSEQSGEGDEGTNGGRFIYYGGRVLWKQADGSIVQPYSVVMNQAAMILANSCDETMKRSEQLEASFYYLSSYISYERSLEKPSGEWTDSYAARTMGSRRGNCYGYAAAFAYVARGLGYPARVCTGTVASALGGRTDHAWTEVKIKNKWYIFDAEMQNAKGSGYYKQTYDSYPAGPIEKQESYFVDF
ncbi:transglutaminase domain-containing protein [Butyrivibrio sp. VCB2006]|uniref:transglutaminase domain-containing protein n=1 Tax=Butyrivibrio sp. VCB2006 TaxID=1280679 RepID=UPI00049247D3|nr:transglutaminase domain-containing protein [Butyrivibrio sp. VCB2006]